MTSLRDRRWKAGEEPEALWSRLSDAWRDLRTVLSSLLSLSMREVSFTGPIASLSFKYGTRQPRGVLLARLYRTDTGASSPVTFDGSWTYADGNITTTAFSALAAATWRANFLIIGGE